MKIAAGKFDRKVILTKKTVETSNSGAIIYNNNPIEKTVWAHLFENKINNQVSEGISELTLMSRQLEYYLIRYIPDLDTEYILKYNDISYEIEAIEEVSRRKYLKLRCEKIKGGVN
jgi:hypothetical protein